MMKTIIPYEHDIKFDTKIAEITSISLEHEDKLTDNEIMGDFIISGDYKVHAISVNREEFKYRLPFSIELADNLIRDSINYDVSDFTYDIKDNNILTVKIEMTLNAEEVEEPIPEIVEEPLTISEPVIDTLPRGSEDISVNVNPELDAELNSMINAQKETNVMPINDSEITNTENSNNITDASKDIIMNNVTNTANTYITYNVYIVKDNDTIDSICDTYKVSKDLLQEYNDIHDIKIGDKLLIPELKDE